MIAISTEQLLALARIYSEATGLSLGTVSTRACGKNNGKAFNRLANGHGVFSSTITRAAEWFAANWPINAEWPQDVPRTQPVETYNAIEVSPAGKKIRLRIDRVIDWRLAIKIVEMIGEAELSEAGDPS
jgi:hypothetical protein